MAYRFFCKLKLTEYPQTTKAETLDRVWIEHVDSILDGSVYQIHSSTWQTVLLHYLNIMPTTQFICGV